MRDSSVSISHVRVLTEVPIAGLLMVQGMDKGSTLAMLLSESAPSLPGMMIFTSFIDEKRNLTNTGLIFLMAILCEVIFAALI